MKLLVIGSGGREHSLVWKLAQSPRVEKMYAAPGNAGMTGLAECVAIGAEDIDGLVTFAREKAIDLAVVGPEAPLTMGLADRLEEAGIMVSGASGKAARIEGSKGFAKDLMAKYNVPTANYQAFDDYDRAREYIKQKGGPLVVKADGLAAGKGVLLCQTEEEALKALGQVMRDRAFGSAGDRVIIEEFLLGEEASFLVFTDGKSLEPMPTTQDHKAVFDGDKGLNTGGMGAYSPAPVVTPTIHAEVMDKIMNPVVKAMEAEGCPYKGILYAGLMIGDKGPQVVEFNARFGDPECQPLMLRLKTDLVDIFEAIAKERLAEITIEWHDAASLCLVLASEGYPGSYEKGHVIEGLDQAGAQKDVVVFHAGTSERDGEVVTSGGRVLGVTALGTDVAQARDRAYHAAELISWHGKYNRTDIGMKAINRPGGGMR